MFLIHFDRQAKDPSLLITV